MYKMCMTDKVKDWIALRKKTTIVHILFGILCAIASMEFFPSGIILLLLFAFDELWDDLSHGTKCGVTDWWESFFAFCISFAVILFLDLIGKISIRWC
jgi:hypothetical protein